MIGELVATALAAMAVQTAPLPALEDSDYPLQRRRVMALVAQGDCDGAHGAVFVMADRAMLDLVEGVCPMGTRDVLRWDMWNPDEFAGMFTDAQIAASYRLAAGEELPVAEDTDASAPPADY
jgi:hypothetical protein